MLSAACDLNPNPAPGPKYLSTAIDFTDTRASLETVMSVAGYFRLDEGAALVVLAEVMNAVAGWREVAKSRGLTNRDIDLMQPAFVHPETERARDLTQLQ